MQILLPDSVLKDSTLRLDWTTFSNILECHRKGYHLAVCKRELDYEDSSRTFGKAVHAALDVWQQVLQLPSALASRSTVLRLIEDAVENEFEGVQRVEGDHRTPGRAKDVLGLYLKQYWDEDQSFDIVSSEESGEMPLGEIELDAGTWESKRTVQVLWQYRIDGTWRDRRSGKLYVKDTKTAKREFEEHGSTGGPGRDAVMYQMSGQLQGYCWVKNAAGAIVDHIAVLPDLLRATAKSKPRTQFSRKYFEWSAEQIEEWKRRTLAQVKQWLEALCRGDAAALMNQKSCAWPSVCQFYSVCEQRDEESRMRWLSSGRFKDRTWNPLKV